MSLLPFASKPGGSGGAPTGAQYVTLASDGTLSAERVLTAGNSITITDGGANSIVTVAQASAAYFKSGVNRSGSWSHAGSANNIRAYSFYVPKPTIFSNITFYVQTADNSANLYDIGFYNSSGNLQAHIGATSLTTAGGKDLAISGGGSVTIVEGTYYWTITGNAIIATIATSQASGAVRVTNAAIVENSSGGVLPSTITIPGANWANSIGGDEPFFAIHN